MPAEVASRLTTRAYQQGDEAAILDLFMRSFHVQRDLEHWRWKYQRNPWGNEHITLVFDEERLVGHYAGYAVPFFDRGVDAVSHQIGDTMTEVSVRHVGRGPTSVLGRAAAHFYETFCDRQVAFNYGFNVSNIQRFSVRFLRSDVVGPVAYRARNLRTQPMPAIGRLSRRIRGYQLEVVTRVSADWDVLFDHVAPAYEFLVRRDARYVQWRYLDCPDVRYIVVSIRRWKRLVGWIVYRVRENRFVVGDALVDPNELDALEVALRHLVHTHPVELVEAWFPERPKWLQRSLENTGLTLQSEPQDLSVMCVPFAWADATVRMRDRLYYTAGDSDLF